MALERLSLAPVITAGGGDDDVNKAPRLPRWTRQELLVLIQGKRVAENRVRRGGSSQPVEPKWSSVSSYCKRHGVNRGPVQCRKRWSNLAGDFKRIKEWEEGEEGESFWVMRNDLRRERKLPGFFDREVYDILLDAGGSGDKSLVLSLAAAAAAGTSEEKKEVVFDSGGGRTEDDGLFSEEEEEEKAAAPTPISDKETSPEGRKRKRDADAEAEEMSVEKQLIEAMERNGRLLASQLEMHNKNSELDRAQRKDDANSLFSVLNKLADAMLRIADKL